MATLFALAPFVEDPEIGNSPVIPEGWSIIREGNTGWYSLYANSIRLPSTCILLLDKQVVVNGILKLYQVTVPDENALSLLAGLVSQVPWYATVEELRTYRDSLTVPSGALVSWEALTVSVLDNWVDERPDPESGDEVTVYSTLAGFDSIEDSSTTSRSEIEERINQMVLDGMLVRPS